MVNGPYSEEFRAAVVAEYAAGMPWAEILASRNIGRSTVSKWVKAAGVPLRQTQRRSRGRGCEVADCDRPHKAKGRCTLHYGRDILGYQPREDRWSVFDHEARLEDCQWMARWGESLDGAARRIGVGRGALEKWLRKYDPDTLRSLLRPDQYVEREDGAA